MKRPVLILLITVVTVSILCAQSKVTKKNIEGVLNFAEVESIVACAGTATAGSMAEIKKIGRAHV